MSLEKINIRNWVVVLFILVFTIFRTFSPEKFGAWANFTPVGAIALFGGTYLKNKWKAFLIPLSILFIADIFINYSYFGEFVFLYEGIVWVYLSFALIVAIGLLIKNVTALAVFISALLSVFIHWVVADIGVWYNNPIFDRNLSGFIECLIVAIPFEKNFLFGTFLYSAVMFGGFEYVKSKMLKEAWA